MSSKEPLFKRIRGPMFLIVLTILMSFLVPAILAEPVNTSKDYDTRDIYNSDLAYDLNAYFSMMNCNDPGNSYVLVNYYFENGSSIRMVFGVDSSLHPSLNLDYENNNIQVFDNKGKISGLGFQSKSKQNLFIYVPV